MPITDIFDVPDDALRMGQTETRDGTAMDHLYTLTTTMWATDSHPTYARGTWGYTSE
jgi:hypothetical protein